MPVSTSSVYHFSLGGPGAGGQPGAPTRVSSITADASAGVAFLPPADTGGGAITHYVVTPYIGASPQSATTAAVASTTTLVNHEGLTFRRVNVTGLTNSTAYTFTVKARNAYGDSPESAASGANTPLAGLVFGDDFGGPAGAYPDPEWWVYAPRCGYLAQNEVAWYVGDHCVLDGSSHLVLTAEHVSYGPAYTYPSDGRTLTQPWRSGACQGNTRLFTPAAGNTMTFESRFQVNAGAGSGYWPGMFWLEGETRIDDWKTDPYQGGWNDTGLAEIDVAEWYMTGSPDSYGNVTWAGSNNQQMTSGTNLSAAQHTYSAAWKPGVDCKFYRDGSQTNRSTSQIPSAGARFFLLLYLQMLGGGSTATQSIYIEWVRVFDQNLG